MQKSCTLDTIHVKKQHVKELRHRALSKCCP